jgi:hypothetical protein
MRDHFKTFILGLILGLTVALSPSLSQAASALKSQVLKDIQQALEKEQKARSLLTLKLTETLKEMSSLSPHSKNFDEELESKEINAATAKEDLFESKMRLDFLEQLMTAVEGRSINDIKKDIPDILVDLSQKQILSNSEQNKEDNLWLFEIYFSIAVKELMEPTENFGEFMRKFMVHSSLKDPESPSSFLKERKYIGKK